MTHASLIRRAALLAAAMLIGLGIRFAPAPPAADSAVPGTLALRAPAFVSAAYAQEPTPEAADLQAVASQIQNEAGIAAYFQAPAAIDLTGANLRATFRTIDTATSAYLIGSVEVPNYTDNDDAKVYVSASGWALAYYPKAEPTAKIFDYKGWNGETTIPSKLDRVLKRVADAISVSDPTISYYHFQHPNATRLQIIGDLTDPAGIDSFQVKLPSTFAYDDLSWSLACKDCYGNPQYFLNTAKIAEGGPAQKIGTFTMAQLPRDTFHTIELRSNPPYGSRIVVSGMIVIIYRVP